MNLHPLRLRAHFAPAPTASRSSRRRSKSLAVRERGEDLVMAARRIVETSASGDDEDDDMAVDGAGEGGCGSGSDGGGSDGA